MKKSTSETKRFSVYESKFHGGNGIKSCDTIEEAMKIPTHHSKDCQCSGNRIIDNTGKLDESDIEEIILTKKGY